MPQSATATARRSPLGGDPATAARDDHHAAAAELSAPTPHGHRSFAEIICQTRPGGRDPNNEERASATAAISEYVRGIVHGAFPGADPDVLSTTVWALVHGLAFLLLDGKLDASTPKLVADQVSTAPVAG